MPLFILITMGFFIFTVLLLALRGFALNQMVVMVVVVLKGSSGSLSSLFGLIVVGGLQDRYHLVGRHNHLRQQSISKIEYYKMQRNALQTRSPSDFQQQVDGETIPLDDRPSTWGLNLCFANTRCHLCEPTFLVIGSLLQVLNTFSSTFKFESAVLVCEASWPKSTRCIPSLELFAL